jgi:hypothetical protein
MIRGEFYIPDITDDDTPLCNRQKCDESLKAEQDKLKDQVGKQIQQKYLQMVSLLK